ncbi:MAG: hypothetical protein ABIN54_09130 [candidate division WOR-3 bacterium]
MSKIDDLTPTPEIDLSSRPPGSIDLLLQSQDQTGQEPKTYWSETMVKQIQDEIRAKAKMFKKGTDVITPQHRVPFFLKYITLPLDGQPAGGLSQLQTIRAEVYTDDFVKELAQYAPEGLTDPATLAKALRDDPEFPFFVIDGKITFLTGEAQSKRFDMPPLWKWAQPYNPITEEEEEEEEEERQGE